MFQLAHEALESKACALNTSLKIYAAEAAPATTPEKPAGKSFKANFSRGAPFASFKPGVRQGPHPQPSWSKAQHFTNPALPFRV